MSGDFWSRRRAAVAAETDAEAAALAAEEAARREAAAAERDDAEILAELDLPEPETVESPEDLRAFLKADLPARLRRRALRHLWRLNPALANLDGLIDYGEDYTDGATVVEAMQTVYEVGSGMMRRVEALVAEAAEAAEKAEEAAAVEGPEAPGTAAAAAEPAAPVEADSDAADALAAAPAPGEMPPPAPVRPRRMQFTFPEQRT